MKKIRSCLAYPQCCEVGVTYTLKNEKTTWVNNAVKYHTNADQRQKQPMALCCQKQAIKLIEHNDVTYHIIHLASVLSRHIHIGKIFISE